MSAVQARAARPAVPELPPMEALEEDHRRVFEVLKQLQSLMERLVNDSVDDEAKSLAASISGFLGSSARQHHADEETHIFPALLASEDAELVQHVKRLQQDHGWLEEDWLELGPQLDALSKGYSWYDVDLVRQGVELFTQLYSDHIALEESLIYPEAKRRAAAEKAHAEEVRLSA